MKNDYEILKKFVKKDSIWDSMDENNNILGYCIVTYINYERELLSYRYCSFKDRDWDYFPEKTFSNFFLWHKPKDSLLLSIEKIKAAL